MSKYQTLEVWKTSMELVKETYLLTKKYPKEEMYAITSQTRRSAISVPANIAEGMGRQYKKDTIQFLHVSRGSLYELETQYYLALDQKYIDVNNFNIAFEQIQICKKLINGFINYYKNKI